MAYTEGHCKEKQKPGGCALHNLQCGYPACDRKEVKGAVKGNAIAALNRVMRQAPCGHENLDNSIGDGKTWAKCEDCGATIEQARVSKSRQAAAQFDEDIFTIRAALEAKAQPKGTPIGHVRIDSGEVHLFPKVRDAEATGNAQAGFALVPTEPTAEMIDAYSLGIPRLLPAYVGAKEKADAKIVERWKAMIAAAPAVQAPAVGAGIERDAARFRWLIDDKNCDETNDTPMVCTSEDVHWGDKARALIDRHMGAKS